MLWSDDTVHAVAHDRIRQRLYDGETERLANRIRATRRRKRGIRLPRPWIRRPPENQPAQVAVPGRAHFS
jgi:hypothetical protein